MSQVVKPGPVLTEGERRSALWMKVKAHLEARLAATRAKNDASASIEKTEKLRGRIAELKYLVNLGEAEPLQEEDERFKD